MTSTQTLAYDPLAKFNNDDLASGIERLFKDAKRKVCKCGRTSLHATCPKCLSKSVAVTQRKRRERRVLSPRTMRTSPHA